MSEFRNRHLNGDARLESSRRFWWLGFVNLPNLWRPAVQKAAVPARRGGKGTLSQPVSAPAPDVRTSAGAPPKPNTPRPPHSPGPQRTAWRHRCTNDPARDVCGGGWQGRWKLRRSNRKVVGSCRRISRGFSCCILHSGATSKPER